MSDRAPHWYPIDSAPKDGQTILLRQGSLLPVHAFWSHGEWRFIEYDAPARPTHWAFVVRDFVTYSACEDPIQKQKPMRLRWHTLTIYHDEVWSKVLRRDPCVYCGDIGGTVEHVDPRGSRSAVINGVGACRSCNQERGSAPLLAYLVWRMTDRAESFNRWNYRHFSHAIRHWQLTAKERKHAALVGEKRARELRISLAECVGLWSPPPNQEHESAF